MEASQVYILISIIVLLAIMIIVFFVKRGKKKEKLTPLASISFGFVIAGIVFADNRLIGYSLMGIGILLAVIDAIRKFRKKR